MTTFKRIKRIRSHAGVYRYLHQCGDAGTIPLQPDIPSPYAYSSDWLAYRAPTGQRVIIRETSHRCYDVFEVPSDL